MAALNPFLDELNPILAMLQYNQVRLAGFITNGTPGIDGDFGGQRYNNVVGMVDPRSFTNPTERPADDRGQAYLPPNFANRLIALGGVRDHRLQPRPWVRATASATCRATTR